MIDNRTTELLPCPLCGGEMSVALHGDEFGWYWWTVQRGHDDATACRCRMFVESDMKFTLEDHEKPEDYPYAMELKDRLVRKWNTRHVEMCEYKPMWNDDDLITGEYVGMWWTGCGDAIVWNGDNDQCGKPPFACPYCGGIVKVVE